MLGTGNRPIGRLGSPDPSRVFAGVTNELTVTPKASATDLEDRIEKALERDADAPRHG